MSTDANRVDRDEALWEHFDKFEEALLAGESTVDLEEEAQQRFGAEGYDLLQTLKALQTLEPLPATQRDIEQAQRCDTVPPNASLHGGHFGRFRILGILGHGGNGIVYHAFDPEVNREIALKLPRLDFILDAAAERRFLREAHAAAALKHPNIVPVH